MDEFIDKERQPLTVSTRDMDKSRDVMSMVGQLIVPRTEGFEHVNLDMSFTYLGNWDIFRVENLSNMINFCGLWKLNESEYILRGKLATILNSSRSRNARSMKLFTDVTTHRKETFEDKSSKQKGFSMFSRLKGGT